MVNAGKLQSDCDDLRFVDSDDSTYLSYWVEGGCNTFTTRIWVQIPSLPNGGKTIYMYYGNDAATNSEASWSGNFVLLADTDCPSGWTRDSSFDGKFIYGSSSYGTTGGSDSHNHGGSISVTTGTPTSTVPPRDPGSGGSSAASSTHTHTALIPIDSTTVLPPYLTMIFCKNTDLNIFSGLIAIYDNATLPSNWTRFTALDDKFPYGGSTYGATGGTATHTHTVSSATTGTQSGDLSINIGYVNYQVVNLNRGTHTHTASPTMTTDSNLPPYISLIYAKASTNPAYSSVISIVDQVPPLGWTRFSNLDNLFGMGALIWHNWRHKLTHHSVTITTSTASSNNNNDGGSSAVSSGNHSHDNGSATTSSQSNLLLTYLLSMLREKSH